MLDELTAWSEAHEKRYCIVDYAGETVEEDFVSATAAYKWLHDLFTPSHIKEMGYHIIREDFR